MTPVTDVGVGNLTLFERGREYFNDVPPESLKKKQSSLCMLKLQLEEKSHSFIEQSYVKKDSSKNLGENICGVSLVSSPRKFRG